MTNQNNLTINGDKWTTKVPSQPGVYWAYAKGYDETVLHVDVRFEDENALVVWVEDCKYPLSEFTHWIGPLLIPEPPIDD